jgi:transposase
VLYFDGTGLWLMTKRLEEGTFAWPRPEAIGAPKLALRPEAFAMLSDGIDRRGAKMRPWFERGGGGAKKTRPRWKKIQTVERGGGRTRAMPEATPREKELSEQLALATAENARVIAQLGDARTEIKLLREKIDALIHRIFGAQSEKLDREQLLLMLQGFDAPGKSPEPVAAEAPRRSTAASPPRERGPRVPGHLPVVEEVIDPEPVKACPEAWRCIGEEVTEQLGYEPAHFFKRRIVRRKYARKDHPFAAPILAPLDTLQDRCIAAPGLIAAVIVGKYCDHLPLYRQEQPSAAR